MYFVHIIEYCINNNSEILLEEKIHFLEHIIYHWTTKNKNPLRHNIIEELIKLIRS